MFRTRLRPSYALASARFLWLDSDRGCAHIPGPRVAEMPVPMIDDRFRLADAADPDLRRKIGADCVSAWPRRVTDRDHLPVYVPDSEARATAGLAEAVNDYLLGAAQALAFFPDGIDAESAALGSDWQALTADGLAVRADFAVVVQILAQLCGSADEAVTSDGERETVGAGRQPAEAGL